MNTFDTFAPTRPPANMSEVVSWFAYMNGHSNVPHPDDHAEDGGILWGRDDLRELFREPLNERRYDAAMSAAYRLTGEAGVDIYRLAMGVELRGLAMGEEPR